MKQRIYKIFTLALLAAATLSCTHNNGDIGVWFGLWRVEQLTVNGHNDRDYAGNIYFGFQSTTVEQKLVHDNHSVSQMFGEWKEEGDILSITFPDPRYWPIDGFLRGNGEENRLTVQHLDGKHIALTFITPNDDTVIYNLVKCK